MERDECDHRDVRWSENIEELVHRRTPILQLATLYISSQGQTQTQAVADLRDH